MGTRRLLLRDFLERALYDRSSGYFSKEVIQSGQALAFNTFASEKDYRVAVARQYASAGRAWMTPVETFQPHYAEALARNMLHTHSTRYPGEPLQILEVGGGNGTCAAGVLSYLRREAPETFASSRYMLVEVSERLADVQRKRLLAEGVPSERWEVVHSCASAWAEALEAPLPGPWFVLALEVLDNLPHDKVRVSTSPGGGASLSEAHVLEQEDGRHREEWRPLQAPRTCYMHVHTCAGTAYMFIVRLTPHLPLPQALAAHVYVFTHTHVCACVCVCVYLCVC